MKPTQLILSFVLLLMLPSAAFNDLQENWGTLFLEKIYCDHTTDIDDDDHLVIDVNGIRVWDRDHVNISKTYAIKSGGF